MSSLTNEQIERYSRHIILDKVGGKGQEKLLNGKVLVIGTGGLGAPAAMYLAAAGVRSSTRRRMSARPRSSRARRQSRR